MFQTKVVEKIKTHILCSIYIYTHTHTHIFFLKNRPVYDIIWKNMVEPGRPRMTVWRMHIARWITKATNTHSEYVILIALPLQQWLQERPSLLRYSTLLALFIVDVNNSGTLIKKRTFTLLSHSVLLASVSLHTKCAGCLLGYLS